MIFLTLFLYFHTMTSQKKRINVLDLFSGCWWLSEGFFEEWYKFIWHIEMDTWACESLKTRSLFHFLKENNKLEEYSDFLQWKITRDFLIEKYQLQNELENVMNVEISDETYPKILEKLQKNLGKEKLQVLVGWPPCQTYSQIWRSRVWERINQDPRNFLYKQYVKFLKDLQPEIFVFENVPGLKTAWKWWYLRDIENAVEAVGYVMKVVPQYMPDYWIPQNRKRLIIIGWKNDSKVIKDYPDLTKYKNSDYDYKVYDFLKDLVKLNDQKEQKDILPYLQDNPLLKSLWIRDIELPFVSGHITRPIRKLDKEIYKIAVQNYKKWKKLNYAYLPEELRTHKNTKWFLNRFNVVAWDDKITSTVVAHIGKDGHYYIHPDASQNRSISVREAARIQTFPDSFKFEWPRTSAYKQIGNAVPPMFSRIIARELKHYF